MKHHCLSSRHPSMSDIRWDQVWLTCSFIHHCFKLCRYTMYYLYSLSPSSITITIERVRNHLWGWCDQLLEKDAFACSFTHQWMNGWAGIARMASIFVPTLPLQRARQNKHSSTLRLLALWGTDEQQWNSWIRNLEDQAVAILQYELGKVPLFMLYLWLFLILRHHLRRSHLGTYQVGGEQQEDLLGRRWDSCDHSCQRKVAPYCVPRYLVRLCSLFFDTTPWKHDPRLIWMVVLPPFPRVLSCIIILYLRLSSFFHSMQTIGRDLSISFAQK